MLQCIYFFYDRTPSIILVSGTGARGARTRAASSQKKWSRHNAATTKKGTALMAHAGKVFIKKSATRRLSDYCDGNVTLPDEQSAVSVPTFLGALLSISWFRQYSSTSNTMFGMD